MRPAHRGSRAEQRVAAEIGAANHRGIGADRRASAHASGQEPIPSGQLGAWIFHVREHARRTAEHVVVEFYAVVHRDVVLDFDVAADFGATCDENVLADGAVVTNARAAHDVREVPDARALPDLSTGIHACTRVDLDFGGRAHGARTVARFAVAAPFR